MSDTKSTARSSPDYCWQSCSAAVWLQLISVILPAAHHCLIMGLANSSSAKGHWVSSHSASVRPRHWDVTRRLREKQAYNGAQLQAEQHSVSQCIPGGLTWLNHSSVDARIHSPFRQVSAIQCWNVQISDCWMVAFVFICLQITAI